MNLFKTAAKDFKGQVAFVIVDTDDKDNYRLLNYFQVSGSDSALIRLVDLKNNMTNYMLKTKELTTENIKSFVKTTVEKIENNKKQNVVEEIYTKEEKKQEL